MFAEKTLCAEHRDELIEITDAVRELVADSGVTEGVALVGTGDPDAGLLITSYFDKKGHEDICDDFVRIWPARDNFRFEGPVAEGAAHSKASVAGQVLDLIVTDGTLQLGRSQGLFFAEYNQPRPRSYWVKIFGAGAKQ